MKKYVSYDKLLLTCIIVLFSIYLSITLISTSFADYTTTATCSHTALGVQYSEVAHPHKYFRTCKSCNTKVYVGGHATKNHGDGSWGSGTCPQCGSHSYPIPTVDQINASLKQHPRIVGVKCKCGSVKYTDPQINPDCSSCISTYNIKSKSATGNSVLYLSYLDGDSGAAISTTFPVPVKMTFQSKYSKSGSNFTSYSSKITCVFNQNSVPPEAKSRLHLFATAQVDYYNNSNSKLYTNTLSAPASNPMPASRTGGKFSKSPIPSYSLAGATGYAEGLIPPRSVSVKLTYTF